MAVVCSRINQLASCDGYENVTEEKVNGSLFKECSYDSHNRLESTDIHLSGETQTYRPIYDNRASDNAIYSDNTVVGITLDGVFTEKTEHDNIGRATEKKLTLGTAVSPLIKDSYTYLDTQLGFEKRLTSMVAEIERRVGGTVKDVLKYTYDNNGNITEIKSGDDLLAKYTYDGLNQLTREDNAVFSKTYTFTYDAGGNILEKKTYSYSTGDLGTLLGTKTYTYASAGWKDRLTSYNGETIAYDALGNPTTYRGHALSWKYINQLASYSVDEDTTLTFDYDAKGIRTRKGNITYTLDGSKILAETRPGGTIKYFYGTSGVVGFEYNNAKYFYLKNAQGDITAIYDEAGNLKAEYEYDAWGNHVVTVDAGGIGTLNPFRYRGYYYDTETGLYYVSSRYYDPEIGRWINADTVDVLDARQDELLGLNLFTYCDNNPVNYFDPTGGILISTCVLIGICIGALIGGAVGSIYGYNLARKMGVPPKDRWKFVVGYGLGGAVVGGVIGGFMGYGIGFLCGATSTSGVALNAISKGLSSITQKTWGHILTKKHAWNLVLKNVTQNGVKNIISQALKEGATTLIDKMVKNGITSMIFESVYSYMGQKIVVRYAVIDGIIKISDAWVKTK